MKVRNNMGTVNDKLKDIVRNWLNIQPSPRKFNNNTRNKHNTTAQTIPIKIAGTILEFFL